MNKLERIMAAATVAAFATSAALLSVGRLLETGDDNLADLGGDD